VAHCWSGTPARKVPGTLIRAKVNEFATAFGGAGTKLAIPSGTRWRADIDLNGDGILDGPGCAATRQQFYAYRRTLDALNPPPDEPTHRTAKELIMRCLGGV